MKTREINKESDMGTLLDWYQGHGWSDAVTANIFPELGFIVDDHAAVWLYVEKNNVMGWMAWQVVNPRKNMAMAFRALKFLYDRVDDEAHRLGLQMIKQTVSHSSLKKLALSHNYLEAEANLTSYVKAI